MIASLNEAKCSLSAVVHNGDLYTFGGYKGHGTKSALIEHYSEGFDEWTVL